MNKEEKAQAGRTLIYQTEPAVKIPNPLVKDSMNTALTLLKDAKAISFETDFNSKEYFHSAQYKSLKIRKLVRVILTL